MRIMIFYLDIFLIFRVNMDLDMKSKSLSEEEINI